MRSSSLIFEYAERITYTMFLYTNTDYVTFPLSVCRLQYLDIIDRTKGAWIQAKLATELKL